ncbi:MAG: ComEC/Rec2 family competence protein [Eubacteriales bacterium]|jgi:competence protein ComEC|nr:ComEC/Rec2 family competence protein [Eubacteriales bacterium]
MSRRGKKNKLKYAIILFVILIFTVIVELTLNPDILETINSRIPKIDLGDAMAVHYIDVGQGDAQLITLGDRAMLIDAGPNSEEDGLLLYLKMQDIDELEYVVFTHPHEDHIGGADMVLEKFCVRNVIMPDVIHISDTYLRMLEAVEKSDSKLIIAAPDREYAFGDASLKILAPISDDYTDLNDWSAVIRLTYGITSFMFMGDAEKVSENDIMNKYNGFELKCDVYKAGHHGSTTSNSPPFLAVCDPEFAVISCGKNNEYGHPHSEILKLFSEMDIEVYRTDIDGTVVLKSDGLSVSKIK